MDLSRDRSAAGRRQLFENISNLYLDEKEKLSERERAQIGDILTKLTSSVEKSIRQALSERLAVSGDAPHDLVLLLANDEIEVARPLLVQSRLVLQSDLMEIIANRSNEHLLVIAERDDLDATLTDLLIDLGEEDVIEALIRNDDAELSQEAMNFLVEESRRVDRFQEPLLARHDIPTDLAHKMFWWVSAALRRHIINNFEIDTTLLDQQIVAATHDYRKEQSIADFGETHADRLVAQMASRNELTEKFLIQTLKSKRIRLFVAGLSLKSGLDILTISRLIHDHNAEALAITCKTLGFDRNSFSAVFLLTRRETTGSDRKHTIDPAEFEAVMKFYDRLSGETAGKVLDYWKLDAGYSNAVEELDSQLASL
ncbi:DUF2336 domain-containing protein [Sneathiella chinensis]|nr:DUF2336 domain-containing protein [Sneathiella chinensis]